MEVLVLVGGGVEAADEGDELDPAPEPGVLPAEGGLVVGVACVGVFFGGGEVCFAGGGFVLSGAGTVGVVLAGGFTLPALEALAALVNLLMNANSMSGELSTV